MNLGDIATVAQGEVRAVTVPFASLLATGETLVGPASAYMGIWPYSPVPDTNAANLIIGSPSIVGTGVLALCGAYGSAGFKGSAAYSLWASVATSAGQTLLAYGQITCDANIPPSATSGATLPNAVTPITSNTTASASTVYALNASGLTLTLPSTWGANAGAVVVSDVSGQGGMVAGPVATWPLNATTFSIAPYGSATFFWSASLSKWIMV